MSLLNRIKALTSRLGRPDDDRPPLVECHLHGHGHDDSGVVAGRGFLVISGHLGQPEYDKIAEAASDMIESAVQRVGVLIDSGGGDMAGIDGAVRALVELRAFLRDDLHTLAEGMAGSSAYALLACGGRGKIFATAGAQVGSVGPKIRLEDSSRLWTEGMLTTVREITDGQEFKPIGAPGFAITPEAIDFETDQVAAAKQVFFRLVAAAKRVPVAEVARAAAKGGLYQASVALELGLVDAIQDKLSFVAKVNGESPPTPSLEEFPMAEREPPTVQPPVVTPAPTPEPVTKAAGPVPAQQLQIDGQAPGQTPEPRDRQALDAAARMHLSPLVIPAPDVGAQIASLTATVQKLAESLAADQLSRTTVATEAAVSLARSRVEACVPRITRSAADQALTAVEAMVRAGQSPDPVITSLEAVPDIADAADLMAEVTYTDPSGQPATQHLDLSHFSSPGKNGEAFISPAVKDRATQGIIAINNAPPGQGMQALEKLYAQVGYLGEKS